MLSENKINILLGTDWFADCDDAIAVRLLTRMSKRGAVNILGIGINACTELSVPSLDAFLKSEGCPDIEIGIDKEGTDFPGKNTYQLRLSSMPGRHRTNDECISGVRLYRKVLSGADGKVDIAEIGFHNILASLLKSQPDDISPLSGIELIEKKVNKLWLMAGKWDDLETGKEYNFAANKRAREASSFVCEYWPTEITFLGYGVGEKVLTGGQLKDGDVLKHVLTDYGHPNGRSSWDPMLVLLACINDEEKAGYSVKRGRASLDIDTGFNHFDFDEKGRHCFVVKKYDDSYYADIIDEIIKS
jgi:purine nucleosidase